MTYIKPSITRRQLVAEMLALPSDYCDTYPDSDACAPI
jgi:hypothetical protein